MLNCFLLFLIKGLKLYQNVNCSKYIWTSRENLPYVGRTGHTFTYPHKRTKN